ncbi:multiheme c-type cytochrome [Candidatus Magnetominusculus dajiuhuensis]|uniref:multiheme c-type cytochrome n=1 Tax=Candidatus Magnetominusculus dajiuhuensis TaxID=3137712 RepID=UPI003B42C80D
MNKRFVFVLVLMLVVATSAYAELKLEIPKELSKESQACVGCHQGTTTSIYQQWGKSKHFRANVGCYECHMKKKGDPGAFEHNGATISVIVSPKDCSKCHTKEFDEFENSHHSKAAHIIGSMDNIIADVAEGNMGMKTEAFPKGVSAAAVNGCWQCHGTTVKVNKDGKLDPATWPNTGMGRINPDGSEGSCSACHQRHDFSVAQARQPENCGKCHMGPDHPQIEIYNESKHGINYYANKDKMNLDSNKWVLGEDYSTAPTCATCHMSATKDMPVTHNVGLRIKWNNRPAQLKQAHETDLVWGLPSGKVTGDMRRANMKKVCVSCHNVNFTDAFFIQYEAEMQLYSEKWAIPGEKLFKKATEVLKAVKGKEYANMSNKIDYTWFEIWHHEGRRARHGASMQAPDYTQWHGNYEIAKHWYGEYVPELKEIIEMGKKSANKDANMKAEELEKLLHEVQASDNHRWSVGNEDPAVTATRLKAKEDFDKRYK